MKRFATKSLLCALALTALATAAPALAQVGPPGGVIYAHNIAYRTVATPTDLPLRGLFDTIYVLGDGLAGVSEVGPGDADFNGGRWEVRFVTFVDMDPMQFTNADDILAAAAMGKLEIGPPAAHFVCPLIR